MYSKFCQVLQLWWRLRTKQKKTDMLKWYNRMCYVYKYVYVTFFLFFKFIVSLSLSLHNRVSYVITRFVNELSYCFHHLPPILPFLSSFILNITIQQSNILYYTIPIVVDCFTGLYSLRRSARGLVRCFFFNTTVFQRLFYFIFFKICCFCWFF